jgi:hypothetical protein
LPGSKRDGGLAHPFFVHVLTYYFLCVSVDRVLIVVVVVCTLVSFFKESGVIELVSFIVVSVTVVLIDESVLTESILAEPLPLQAANDAAMAKANNPFFNASFMIL